MPDTVVALQHRDGTFVHDAYALGFGTDAQGNPVRGELTGACRLVRLAQLLGNLEVAVGADQLGPEEIFVATAYRLQAKPAVETDLAGIEPAPTFVDWPASTGLDLAAAAECAR